LSRKKLPKQLRDELGRFARVVKTTQRSTKRSKLAVKPKAKKPLARPPAKATVKPKVKKPLARPPVKAAVKPKVKKPLARLPVKAAVKPKVKKPLARPPAKAAVKPRAKKPLARPPAKAAVKPRAKKPLARLPAKAAVKPRAKKPLARLPAKAAVKPKVKKPPARLPAKRRPKRMLRDELGRFISPKKLPRPPRKPPALRPPRKPELPLVAERSRAAEVDMQVRLINLQDSILLLEAGLDMAVQTMVNRDGTVDGELTIRNLPDEWRDARTMGYLVATLSSALRTFEPFAAHPKMGGGFWCSFGVRFGPQNEAEIGEMYNLYKRHRGLFQIGTYPTPAWGTGALQVALVGNNVGLKAMLDSLMKKRGLPPSVVMIRFIWTPDGQRPGHYKGEK
jgi:hypothetical protein